MSADALRDKFLTAVDAAAAAENLCQTESRIIADALADGIAYRHIDAYVERYKSLRVQLATAQLAERSAMTKLYEYRIKASAESKK